MTVTAATVTISDLSGTFPARKIDVGPSAPPITVTEVAALPPRNEKSNFPSFLILR